MYKEDNDLVSAVLQTVSGVEDPVPWSFVYVLNVLDMLMMRSVTQM
jgi:hypothetical protein